MNNKLKSNTRITFIKIIFEHISTKKDLNEIYEVFNTSYKNTFVENFNNKKKIKFDFNSNFLKKLINNFIRYKEKKNYIESIDNYINFSRKFEKWDIINKSILLSILSEVTFSEDLQKKIIFNDYLNIGKFFVDQSELSTINAIIDKLINEKK